jgi:hypothetical protein
MSSVNYKLAGEFVECCDCYTICPCWVNERPDEDHCSSLYIWTFEKGSHIQGHPIGDTSVAAAAFYRRRSGVKSADKGKDKQDNEKRKLGRPQISIDPEQQQAENDRRQTSSSNMQSAIYVDHNLDEPTRNLLIDAFSGRSIDRLKSLQRLVGTVVDSGPAKIDRHPSNGGWEITVTTFENEEDKKGIRIAQASYTEATMKGQDWPLSLKDTALHYELGIEGAVELQKVSRFEMAVSPLPGGPFVYAGRSGMAARFNYSRGL